MRTIITILISILYIQTQGQTTPCDTLYLKNDKKIAAVIQSETSTSYKYILCCEGCSEIRTIKKKDIDKTYLTEHTLEKLNRNPKTPIKYEPLIGQSSYCDTLVLKDRWIKAVIIKETPYTYHYVHCCKDCNEKRKVKKVNITETKFTDNTNKLLESQNSNTTIQSPFSISLDFLGHTGAGAGLSLEYMILDRIGFKGGFGYGEGVSSHGSILFKLGKDRRFVPSIGFTNINGLGDDFFAFTSFYSFQKSTDYGYLRISPGIFVVDDVVPFFPWLGLSVGFNLFSK